MLNQHILPLIPKGNMLIYNFIQLFFTQGLLKNSTEKMIGFRFRCSAP